MLGLGMLLAGVPVALVASIAAVRAPGQRLFGGVALSIAVLEALWLIRML